MISSFLLGGFARMMMRHVPTIVETISNFFLNRQQIKLAELKVSQPQNGGCQTVCNYSPKVEKKDEREPVKVKIWKGVVKIGIVGVLFCLLLSYLIYDFLLLKDLLQGYKGDQMYIIKILENYREIALEFLSFVTSWALADQVDGKLFDKK